MLCSRVISNACTFHISSKWTLHKYAFTFPVLQVQDVNMLYPVQVKFDKKKMKQYSVVLMRWIHVVYCIGSK
jgi:hypothetical protein